MNEITVYYLEMTQPGQLVEKTSDKGLVIREAVVKQWKVNRFLYDLIGEDWAWLDKLGWSAERWAEYAESDRLRTWIAYSQGSIAGYFELKKIDASTTELAYFGLAPRFVGCGFGGYFLSQAVNEAWRWDNTKRVIVNTCSLDHPVALSNYKSRGFRVYDQKTVASEN